MPGQQALPLEIARLPSSSSKSLCNPLAQLSYCLQAEMRAPSWQDDRESESQSEGERARASETETESASVIMETGARMQHRECNHGALAGLGPKQHFYPEGHCVVIYERAHINRSPKPVAPSSVL